MSGQFWSITQKLPGLGSLMPFLSLSDNMLQNAFIIFQNSVDNFEIAYKTCLILVWVAVPP